MRQAINHAIDRDLLVEKVLNGLGTAGSGPAGLGRRRPGTTLQLTDDEQLGFDPEKAKALLDEAGWKDTNGDGVRDKDGTELKLRLFDRPGKTSQQATPFITGWLKDVGIDTEVKSYDDTQLTPIIGKGEYDLFIWGWTPFVDPDPMLSYFTSVPGHDRPRGRPSTTTPTGATRSTTRCTSSRRSSSTRPSARTSSTRC